MYNVAICGSLIPFPEFPLLIFSRGSFSSRNMEERSTYFEGAWCGKNEGGCCRRFDEIEETL